MSALHRRILKSRWKREEERPKVYSARCYAKKPTPPITVANLLEPSPTLPALSLPLLQPPQEEIDKTAMVTLEEEQARVVVREVLRKAILRTNQWLVFYEDGDECIEHEDDLNRE
jgi:hypothetical protein